MSKTLAALMILTLVGGIAIAQPAPTAAAPAPAAKTQAPVHSGMQGMKGMMHGPAIPDMTPEQMEKMDALRTALVKEMLPLRTDLRVKEIELDALWRADEPDAKKIIAKVKEIGDIREKIEITRINHRFEMRKLMTPEQRKAMKKMGMHRGMMRGKMGRGMGRGMRRMMRGQMDGCPQGPMMGQGGPHGCQDCDMH